MRKLALLVLSFAIISFFYSLFLQLKVVPDHAISDFKSNYAWDTWREGGYGENVDYDSLPIVQEYYDLHQFKMFSSYGLIIVSSLCLVIGMITYFKKQRLGLIAAVITVLPLIIGLGHGTHLFS